MTKKAALLAAFLLRALHIFIKAALADGWGLR
jgi:hypothetical protein